MRVPDSRKLPRPAREFSGEFPKSAQTPAESGRLWPDEVYQNELPDWPPFSQTKTTQHRRNRTNKRHNHHQAVGNVIMS